MTNWWLFLFPVNVFLAKICCSWSADKFAKRATCEFFSALFLLLVGSGPKRSMPTEKLGSSSLVSSIFEREGKMHCSLTGRKLWSQVKKCSRIYARPCVKKDFVHSGSIGLIYRRHARYVIGWHFVITAMYYHHSFLGCKWTATLKSEWNIGIKVKPWRRTRSINLQSFQKSCEFIWPFCWNTVHILATEIFLLHHFPHSFGRVGL